MVRKADPADISGTASIQNVAKKPTATSIPTFEEIKDSAPDSFPGQVTLALDISGKCIGWAIGMEGELLLSGKYVFKGTASKAEKLYAFYELLESLYTGYEPTMLVSERPDPRAGTRNHFEFLGVLRLFWFEKQSKDLEEKQLLGARTIKKHMHVDLAKGDNRHAKNKQLMVHKVNTLFGLDLKFDITTGSSYRNDDDIADAIAVLVTYWKLHGHNANG